MKQHWLIALLFALIDLRSIICCNLCRLSSLRTSKLHFRPYGVHTGIPKDVKLSIVTGSQPQSLLLPLPLHRRISKPTETNSNRGAFFNDILSATDESQTKIKEVLISWIRWYRNTLSPIMPPNCRFLPSCSNYAMQAIAEHGSYRGLILTTWRILRCNPFGGSGYDPPVWPPPGFFAGSTSRRQP